MANWSKWVWCWISISGVDSFLCKAMDFCFVTFCHFDSIGEKFIILYWCKFWKKLFHFTRCFSFEAHAQTAYCNFRHLFLECARLLVSVDPSGALLVFCLVGLLCQSRGRFWVGLFGVFSDLLMTNMAICLSARVLKSYNWMVSLMRKYSSNRVDIVR